MRKHGSEEKKRGDLQVNMMENIIYKYENVIKCINMQHMIIKILWKKGYHLQVKKSITPEEISVKYTLTLVL